MSFWQLLLLFLLGMSPNFLAISMKSLTACDMMYRAVSWSPAVSIAVSSTYIFGAARGLSMHSLCTPVRNKTLVRATECLHPARIEVLVMTVLLQKLSHCMILGAICCCMVMSKSTMGKSASIAFSRSMDRLMVSKNF